MYVSVLGRDVLQEDVVCVAIRKGAEKSFKYLFQRGILRCGVNEIHQNMNIFCIDPSCSDLSLCCVCNSETCGSTVCAWGARCVQNKCECPQCSGEAFSPVCGSDSTTYNNECELRMSSCMQKRRIDVAKPGSCDEGRKWTL